MKKKIEQDQLIEALYNLIDSEIAYYNLVCEEGFELDWGKVITYLKNKKDK